MIRSLTVSTLFSREALSSSRSYWSISSPVISSLANVVLPMPAAPENSKCGIDPSLIH